MENIHIISSFGGSTFKFLEDYSQVAVIVDENTIAYCYPLIEKLLPHHHLIEIKSGEERKNLDTCTDIWSRLTSLSFDRHAVVLNLGGGVIGDMGGFCAATYKRGIDFVQIPTTLLAQVDASVGGKLGVDFHNYKNHIGVFQEPAKVIVCPSFLKTLPERELRSGFAEVLKHGLIRKKIYWEKASQTKLQDQKWDEVIAESIHIKYEVVKADPTEKGLRKILNFGHTIGHAVESYLLEKRYRKLLHGEAVAVGMIAESYLAQQKGFITQKDLTEIQSCLLAIFGKAKLSASEIKEICAFALQDKKNQAGVIKASLLNAIGEANINQAISTQEVAEALLYYEGL